MGVFEIIAWVMALSLGGAIGLVALGLLICLLVAVIRDVKDDIL
jgi:hypothetical protein